MKPDFFKPLIVTFSVLFVFFLTNIFFPPAIGLVVPGLLLFVPILILPPIQEPQSFVQNALATLFLDRSPKQFGKSVLIFVIVTLVVFPPYLFFAHFWMLHVFHDHGFRLASWTVFTNPLVYQLLMVAFPEEFFFRGYLQTSLNKVFQPRWRFFGVSFGWGLILTSLIFAFAHSVIAFKWWHFSIFFPSLLFGHLKEKTGSLTAPILFHAFCNTFMNWFVSSYF